MSKHVKMADLYNNGIAYEIVVVQENKSTGDLFFIKTMDLDEIDMERMRRILRRREADRLAVWDLLDTITLPNGVNALEYFHQLVLVKTLSGEIIKPDPRRRGIRVGGGAAPKFNDDQSQESAPAAVRQGTKRAPKPDTE